MPSSQSLLLGQAGHDEASRQTGDGVTPRRTVLVVGGGLSGTLIAVRLLRQAGTRSMRVILLDRTGVMARGVAYGTQHLQHVLNVPVGNMSACDDDPDEFFRYCLRRDATVTRGSFVPRWLYGSYLGSVLTAAEGESFVRFERVTGEAVSATVDTDAGLGYVTLDDGRTIAAAHIVLAHGHSPPADPVVSSPDFFSTARYTRDPWGSGGLPTDAGGQRWMLLGSGLTAIDVALALRSSNDPPSIVCVSRRGLLPAAHRALPGDRRAFSPADLLDEMGSSCSSYVRALRRAVRLESERGGDWRDVVASLRADTPDLWRRLPADERARFVRHVRPYWEAARHRCAPEPHERFSQLMAQGAVRLIAGRVTCFDDADGRVIVTVRTKLDAAIERVRIDHVVNCTGPSSDAAGSRNPLIESLLTQGVISPDPLRLGIEVDDEYAARGTGGASSPIVRYIGPMLKARDWEATAVPELRHHASELANILLRLTAVSSG